MHLKTFDAGSQYSVDVSCRPSPLNHVKAVVFLATAESFNTSHATDSELRICVCVRENGNEYCTDLVNLKPKLF